MSSLPLPGAFKFTQADAELFSRRVTTDDPESEPNILESVPANGRNAVIALAYDLPEGIEVRCRHCRSAGKQPNHRHGYVVRYDGGEGILVGNKCGRDHYKDEWGLIEGVWKQRRGRRSALARLADIRDNWDVIRTELLKFSDSPMWGIHDTMSRNLREKTPRFQAYLVTVLTQHDGQLHIMETYRDVRAEENLPDNTKQKEVLRVRKRNMGSIGGQEFLFGAGFLKSGFEDTRANLIKEIEALRKVGSDLATEELEKRLRRISALFKQIKTAVHRVRSLRAFVDLDHIERLCICATDWNRQRDGRDTYSFDGQNIVWNARGAGIVKVPVQRFEVPSTTRLQMFIG